MTTATTTTTAPQKADYIIIGWNEQTLELFRLLHATGQTVRLLPFQKGVDKKLPPGAAVPTPDAKKLGHHQQDLRKSLKEHLRAAGLSQETKTVIVSDEYHAKQRERSVDIHALDMAQMFRGLSPRMCGRGKPA